MLNAGRKYLGTEDLAGKVFVSSGLGGMSGAQPKAAVIAGCIGVIAEVVLNTCSFLFSVSVLFIAGPEWLSPYSDSLRAGGFRDRIPVGTRFSAPVQTGPGAHPASYIGYRGYPRDKLSWGLGVNHPPHLVPRLKNE